MTWAATSTAASAAIPPNTPSAIDSGSMARSAFATSTEVAVTMVDAGSACLISASTAATSRLPRSSWSPLSTPLAQHWFSGSVSAGVNNAASVERSTSSCTNALLGTTIPTSLMPIRRRGRRLAVWYSGRSVCALV